MKKILLIIGREYSTRVKKKSFLLTTILIPVIIIGFYAAIIGIAISGGTESETVAVIDKAGLFDGKPESTGGLNFEIIRGETEESFRLKYIERKYNLFLSIPEMDFNKPVRPNLYYAKSIGPVTQSRIEDVFNKAV